MKKTIALLFVMLPTMVIAQTKSDVINPEINPRNNQEIPKWEVGTTNGFTFSEHAEGFSEESCIDLTLITGLGLYRNLSKNWQVGITADADVLLDEYYDLSPQLVVNRTIRFNKAYIYAGASAGYNSRQHSNDFNTYTNRSSKGYIAGLQAGIVFNISHKFSVNMETGTKFSQMWNETNTPLAEPHTEVADLQGQTTYNNTPVSVNFVELHFPTRFGIRYTF